MKAFELGLVGSAAAGAHALERAFPGIVFTSGRRAIADQARAMARNVIQSRQWIAETYAASSEREALQGWLDRHAKADTIEEIAAGLTSVMASWAPERLAKLSSHFSGLAFDVRPESSPRAARILAMIRGLPGLARFLEREGGLVRWHAQFH